MLVVRLIVTTRTQVCHAGASMEELNKTKHTKDEIIDAQLGDVHAAGILMRFSDRPSITFALISLQYVDVCSMSVCSCESPVLRPTPSTHNDWVLTGLSRPFRTDILIQLDRSRCVRPLFQSIPKHRIRGVGR